MTSQEYIEKRLEYTKSESEILSKLEDFSLEEKIKKILLSKKFRKYSANEELIKHIEKAISLNIKEGKPINVTFLNGAYKLWRLEESPEADWAELFTLMYLTNWLKPICKIYEPGVWLDFFMDDLIIPRLNNIDILEVRQYINSFNKLLSFMKDYQPDNMKITLTPVGSLFKSENEFNKSLEKNLEKFAEENPDGPPEISDRIKAMVELNVKATDDQTKDPLWRERVWNIHTAYLSTKSEPSYHNSPYKIKAFTQPLSKGMTISVGTTKTSVAKFWVGVGALERHSGDFRETILTITQLNKVSVKKEKININGLNGKNFDSIRIFGQC